MNDIQKKSKHSNNSIFIYITLAIYMFFVNVANFTLFSDIGLILLTVISIIYILNNKKLYFNIYFILYLLFVIYQCILIFTGVATHVNQTTSNIRTMIINFFILLCIYNIIIISKNIERFMNTYIIVSAISLVFIMLMCKDNLFSGRLAHAYGEDAVSYYFFGQAVAISANGIAFYCSISALFSIYFYYIKKDAKYLFLSILFIVGVMLTGSRKGILVLLIYIGFIINLIFKKKIGLKILIGIGAIGAIWLLITKVPAFYSIIGERLIMLIDNFRGISTYEGSILAREFYKEYALEWFSQKPWLGYGVGAFSYVYGNGTESNYLEMLVGGRNYRYCDLLSIFYTNNKKIYDVEK